MCVTWRNRGNFITEEGGSRLSRSFIWDPEISTANCDI